MRPGSIVWLGLALAGCGRGACSTTGCLPLVDVVLEQPLAGPGRYEVALVVEGEAVRCATELPLALAGPGCDADRASLVHSEAPTGALLEGVSLRTASIDPIAMTVHRDGRLLADLLVTPVAEDWTPTGASCGEPTCRYAVGTVPLDAWRP